MLQTIQREIQAVDPNLPLINVRTMSDVLNTAMWVPRTGAALLLLFGAIALSLAVVRIYRVDAFFLRPRLPELGGCLAPGGLGGKGLWPPDRRTPRPPVIPLSVGPAAASP